MASSQNVAFWPASQQNTTKSALSKIRAACARCGANCATALQSMLGQSCVCLCVVYLLHAYEIIRQQLLTKYTSVSVSHTYTRVLQMMAAKDSFQYVVTDSRSIPMACKRSYKYLCTTPSRLPPRMAQPYFGGNNCILAIGILGRAHFIDRLVASSLRYLLPDLHIQPIPHASSSSCAHQTWNKAWANQLAKMPSSARM